jgi:hypothetical protein
MALFSAQVFKEGHGEKWSNRYIIEASGLAAAVACHGPIVEGELSVHKSTVTITAIRISDLNPATDQFVVVPYNSAGLVTATADILPLFNTCRIDVEVEGFGRPSRKYYRLPLAEDEQDDGVLSSVTGTAVADMVTQMITDVDTAGGGDGELVDPDGQSWISATHFTKVQMRQLHRRRRRSLA